MAFAGADVAVVGGGIVGLAATDALRRRGTDAVCLERAEPGGGQSAGAGRVLRHLHAHPALIALAVRARAGWREWEREAGVALLGDEGVVRLGGGADELAALRAAGVRAELPPAADAARRLPMLAAVEAPVLLDADGGAIRAAAAIELLARRLGAAGLRRAAVRAIEPAPGGRAVLRTDAGDLRCRRCLVCAGAGTERLTRPLGIDPGQRRRAHLRLTFRVRAADAGPAACLSDRSGAFGEAAYGTPDGPGRYAVGLGAFDVYPEVGGDADAVPAGVDLARARERLLAYVGRALPGLDPEPVGAVLRLTTALPADHEDAFGLWRRDGVLVFAGHNLFKFAPVLGQLLADAAAGDRIDPIFAAARALPG